MRVKEDAMCVACSTNGENVNEHRAILRDNQEVKNQFVIRLFIWGDNFKMNIKEIGWEFVN